MVFVRLLRNIWHPQISAATQMPDDRDLEPIRIGARETEPNSHAGVAGSAHLVQLMPVQREADYVLDLRFLFLSLWSGRWILSCFLVAGILFAVWRLYTHEPAYEAYLIVAPTVTTSPFGGMRESASGLVRSLGLAADLEDKEASAFERLQVLLGSISLAERLQNKYGLLQVIYHGKWDDQTESWLRPSGALFELKQSIRRVLHLPTWKEPDLESLAGYVKQAIKVEEIEKTPLQRLSLQYPDRDTALHIMKAVYEEADDLLREQDKLEASERKAYLLKQLGQVTVADNRVALINLLTNVEQSLMLLDSDLPYAGRVLEPPRATVQPVPPNLLMTVALPIAGSLFLGVLIVTLVQAFRHE